MISAAEARNRAEQHLADVYGDQHGGVVILDWEIDSDLGAAVATYQTRRYVEGRNPHDVTAAGPLAVDLRTGAVELFGAVRYEDQIRNWLRRVREI